MIRRFLYIIASFLLLSSCTEPYPLDSANNFESYLVVEGRITNNMKIHEVKLSRTYRLEEEGGDPVSQAEVRVIDDLGNIFPFHYDSQENTYKSNEAFQALPDREYQLYINDEGTEYTSTVQQLTATTSIESINAIRKTVDGVEGVELAVNSFDPTGSSTYYRYEYEETYKVVAPYYSPIKAVVLGPQNISFEATDEYVETCYATESSTGIILHNTSSFSEDRVDDFPVRFISKENGIIAHRYSIKITQFVQSYEAYSFYETLKELSQEGSVLSPNQPGFVAGNLSPVEGSNDKVVGLFEVASESSARIFFNFLDVFPEESVPGYIFDCTISELNSQGYTPPNDMDGFSLIDIINSDYLILYSTSGSIYTMVSPECGDCSTFASPEAPEFWEE